MKRIQLLIFILLTATISIFSQTVSGRLINQFGAALSNAELKLYIHPEFYTTISDLDGAFVFNNIINVEEEELPDGYNISNNYPNPFNPITRINFNLPKACDLRIAVYNILGQLVSDVFERHYGSGNNYIDLELNGLSNGIYLARITIDDKYTVIRKLTLLYGSQHLSAYGRNYGYSRNPVGKSLTAAIDSLVVTGENIIKTTFTNLPPFTGANLDLGSLTVNSYVRVPCPGIPTVNYAGKTYNTVLIGEQCWLKENLDVGTRVNGSGEQTNNDTIEKYCYDNDPNNCATYGGLYQWNEAMQYVTTPGTQGICPSGWHIPTLAEYETLKAAVNNDGNALKKERQGTGSGAGTNTSGFSALLAGYCDHNGNFNNLGYTTYFWSSTEYNPLGRYFMYLFDSHSNIFFYYNTKYDGFSVRCAKD